MQTYKPSSNIKPLHFIGPPSISKLFMHRNISCGIECYIMEANQCTIFASKDVRLYKICTFFNSPLQKDSFQDDLNFQHKKFFLLQIYHIWAQYVLASVKTFESFKCILLQEVILFHWPTEEFWNVISKVTPSKFLSCTR